MAKYKGTEANLLEFGSDDEVGAPCPGNLIRVLSPELQEADRAGRRNMVANMCVALNLEPCTYRQYVMGRARKRT